MFPDCVLWNSSFNVCVLKNKTLGQITGKKFGSVE